MAFQAQTDRLHYARHNGDITGIPMRKHVTLVCELKLIGSVLICVAQLVGRHSAEAKITDMIPGQGTWLGCVFSPWMRCM